MASWWSPNDYFSPSTIDPAKLHDFEDLSEPESERTDNMELTKVSRPKPTKVPPIPKISAQWDPTVGDSPADWHKECWKSTLPKTRAEGWQESYFRYYPIMKYVNIHVPLDPLADDPCDEVVIDPRELSIYDAYMVRTDIARNENQYRRLQVVCRPLTPFKNRYMLFDRTGRVGLQGECVRQMDTLLDLDRGTVVGEFKRLFRHYAGMEWGDRYRAQERPTDSYPSPHYTFIDLDYSREVKDIPGFVQSQVQLPNYQGLNGNLNGPVRLLMEVMLYGGPVASLNSPVVSIPGASFSPFTAPYHTLSLRAITAGFQTLKRIAAYLDQPNDTASSKDPDRPGGIRWKTIVQASSRYRSEIPFCDGWHNSNRPVVISNYYTLFLELRFLHSLYPEAATPEILNLIDELPRRGSLQVWKHGHALTVHPLYQAYSSLPHGFQLLTDTSSLEFREIQAYLHNSCQEDTHRVNFEIQGIYRVFTKTKAQNSYHDWLRSTKADQSPTRQNRLLLWHGTPLNSLLGILETGLQIRKRFPSTPPPPAPPPPPPPPKRTRVTKKHQSRAASRTNSFPIPPPPPTSTLYKPPIKPGILQRTRPKPTSVYTSARNRAGITQLARQRPRFTPGGSMFGDGIYLADASSKSANYCGRGNSYWGGAPPPPPPPPPAPGTMVIIPTAGPGTTPPETNEGTEAILLLCEADVGTKEERVRSLFSIPDGQEVVREFQEKEAQRRELELEREKEAEKEVAMEVDGGFKWTRQKVGDLNGMKSGDDNVWLSWGNKNQGQGGSKVGQGNGDEKMGTAGGKGTGVRCIEGVGRTGPRDTPDGWKKVPWDLGWDWNRSAKGNAGPGQKQQHQQPGSGGGVSGGSDYGDVWMPDTSKPYGLVVREASLLFNEYVIYNPAHVQIRYILRIRIKESRWR